MSWRRQNDKWQFRATDLLVVCQGPLLTNIRSVFHFLLLDFMTGLWEGKSCWPLDFCLVSAICEMALQYWDSGANPFQPQIIQTIGRDTIATQANILLLCKHQKSYQYQIHFYSGRPPWWTPGRTLGPTPGRTPGFGPFRPAWLRPLQKYTLKKFTSDVTKEWESPWESRKILELEYGIWMATIDPNQLGGKCIGVLHVRNSPAVCQFYAIAL